MAQGDTNTSVDPLWFKDAIIYELHVKTFCDSDGDGMGDFRGLMEKLDYLQELGVTAIWLLPFYPSPMRDDGYDIADYFDVNPNFGTLDDFRAFLDAAHDRNLRVITELVINHTSDQNPWFQKSRRAVAAATAAVERSQLQMKTSLTKTFMSGAKRRKNTRTPESFSKISRHPTGHGTRWRRPTTGIAFIHISRT